MNLSSSPTRELDHIILMLLTEPELFDRLLVDCSEIKVSCQIIAAQEHLTPVIHNHSDCWVVTRISSVRFYEISSLNERTVVSDHVLTVREIKTCFLEKSPDPLLAFSTYWIFHVERHTDVIQETIETLCNLICEIIAIRAKEKSREAKRPHKLRYVNDPLILQRFIVMRQAHLSTESNCFGLLQDSFDILQRELVLCEPGCNRLPVWY